MKIENSNNYNNYLLAITAGEPAGIGPDLVVDLAQRDSEFPCLIIADPQILQERAQLQKLALKVKIFNPTHTIDYQTAYTGKGQLLCLPVNVKEQVVPGKLSTANANYVLESIKIAVKLCNDGICQAMVTGPIHKGIINDAIDDAREEVENNQVLANNSIAKFSGHTEYLAKLTHSPRVIMMLATEGLRVALVTTHLALKDVSSAITKKVLTEIISLLHDELKTKFSIKNPRIAICGLNPHAGEGGHMGREEIDTIIPVIEHLKNKGLQLDGPIPADTIFTGKYLKQSDTILAMYHDQGLPVLKYKGFGHAVNITLGLPFIRTSVDHGTALHLAGGPNINSGSMLYAINMALNMLGLESLNLEETSRDNFK